MSIGLSVRVECEHLFVSTREQIADLHARGLRPSEIAVRLDLARPTVDYHLARLTESVPQNPAAAGEPSLPTRAEAVSQVETREAVRQLLDAGHGRLEIARILEVSKSTVSYHCRRLGAPVDETAARRYDWRAIQAYYDAGHTVRECVERFGFSTQSWHAAKNRGDLVTRPVEMPLEVLCMEGVPRSRGNLRRRLIEAGIKVARCEQCGLTEWRGRPVPLSLHHVNGDRHDNRLKNLELLCGNCHGLTDNFAGRNRPRAT